MINQTDNSKLASHRANKLVMISKTKVNRDDSKSWFTNHNYKMKQKRLLRGQIYISCSQPLWF